MSLISEVVDVDWISSKTTTINIEVKVDKIAFILFVTCTQITCRIFPVFKNTKLMTPSIMKAIIYPLTKSPK